jgi:hypothetical protein
MSGHVATLTGLVSRSGRVRSAGKTENNSACQRRDPCGISENKMVFHNMSPVVQRNCCTSYPTQIETPFRTLTHTAQKRKRTQ